MTRQLTNEGVEAVRLVVPVDSQEIDGDPSQHDGQANAAHHRFRVQREDEQESPEDEVNNRPEEADLEDKNTNDHYFYYDSAVCTSLTRKVWLLMFSLS